MHLRARIVIGKIRATPELRGQLLRPFDGLVFVAVFSEQGEHFRVVFCVFELLSHGGAHLPLYHLFVILSGHSMIEVAEVKAVPQFKCLIGPGAFDWAAQFLRFEDGIV
jgi:hypothetical protein